MIPSVLLRLVTLFPSFVICKIVSNEEVLHLIGDPDFRDVSLNWEYDIFPSPAGEAGEVPTLYGFQVHYCEMQAWGPHRCRTKVISPNEGTTTYRKGRSGSKSFKTRIGGLRMATTYSFEVRPIERDPKDLADAESIGKSIIVPTKGSRATQCLPDASEVEVSTGPYFGGRIAVEAADGGPEKCFLQGNPKSAQDAYILRIKHEECGSIVNETTVSTYVIVQENLPILTHSTRRFLVLCTYKPETLTVRAGLSLPSNPGDDSLQYYKPESGSAESYDNSDVDYNTVDDVKHEARTADGRSRDGLAGEIVFVVFLVMASFGMIGFVLWRMVPQLSDDDTESITNNNTRNRLFGLTSKNNRDKYSDNGSIYSISLSDKDDKSCSGNSEVDNTSEA